MRQKKNEKQPILTILNTSAQVLIAIGSPFLVLLKIIWYLLVATGQTGIWLAENVLSSGWKILPKLRPKIPTWKIEVPKINLPGVPLPRKRDVVLVGVSLTIFTILIAIPVSLYIFFSTLPDPRTLAVREVPLTTKIYDRNKTLLYQFYNNENRSLVALSDLPPYVAQATIAVEDQNFYHHPGIDVSAIVRAAYADATGDGIQGASTITQQLIKSTLLSPERTLDRKIREVVLSFWAEKIYSKNQILTMYLNQVGYGGSAYGIEAAAETYFGKHASNLSLAEAAMLAGLPSAPTVYSPFGAHPELAKEREKQVLEAMVKQNYITSFAAESAFSESLKLAPIETSIKAPHFVMYVKDYLVKKYGLRAVEQGGLSVITSLDYPTYEKTLKLVQDGVEKQKYLNVGNGAALVTNPRTGEILAMVGSTDFFDTAHDGNVNVTISPRSPGSSIKPLNYALAFEKGIITPATIIDDAPITYKVDGQPPYSPIDYDGKWHGKVTARVALGSSFNVPAVKVLQKNGLQNFIDFSKTLGITTFDDPNRFGLSLTLGGGEVLMTDMATAYSSFANSGMRVKLKPVLKVEDYKGDVLENNGADFSNRVMSPQTAYLINSILADDGARAMTFGPGSYLNIPKHTVAVKTGTTETKRDNWTIGYSFGPDPKLVAVWVGNNDNTPMSPYLESGNTGAAAIWNPIMTTLLAGQSDSPMTKPDNVVAVEVCAIGGMLPCENCPIKKTEYFIRGTEPKQACTFTKTEAEKAMIEKHD